MTPGAAADPSRIAAERSAGLAKTRAVHLLARASDLDRIAEARLAAEKYHRRSRLEQFSSDMWKSPDEEIWW